MILMTRSDCGHTTRHWRRASRPEPPRQVWCSTPGSQFMQCGHHWERLAGRAGIERRHACERLRGRLHQPLVIQSPERLAYRCCGSRPGALRALGRAAAVQEITRPRRAPRAEPDRHVHVATGCRAHQGGESSLIRRYLISLQTGTLLARRTRGRAEQHTTTVWCDTVSVRACCGPV